MLVGLIRKGLDPWLARNDRSAPAQPKPVEVWLPTGERMLECRLYPQPADDSAVLVFFHGGGLVSSSLDTHDALCRRLAAGTGFEVLSVGYRRAPDARWPAAHDDAEAAVAWAGQMTDHSKRYSRLYVGGDSAGGLLAVAAAQRQARAGRRPVDGLALFYPLVSLAARPDDPRAMRLSKAWMRRQYVGPQDVADDRDLDPLGADPWAPPMFVVSGGRDPTRLQIKQLRARLPDAPLTEHLEPAGVHGFMSLAGVSARARAQTDRAIAALKTAFAP